MEDLKLDLSRIEDVTDEELAEATGAKKGSGWLKTVTDDCPNSVFVCC